MRRLGLLFSALLLAGSARAAAVYYVDDSAAGAANGTSWANAFTNLQAALDVAVAGDEIRVAAGSYFPSRMTDPPNPRTVRFDVNSNIRLTGGFAGAGAADPDARDVAAYETILSGDIDHNDLPNFANRESNAYRILRMTAGTIDGFTLKNGNYRSNINGTISTYSAAALEGFNCAVANCFFTSNMADEAGAVYLSNSSMTHCRVSSNYAKGGGGGMKASASTITGCVFEYNDGNTGGAIWSYVNTIKDCIFRGNLGNRVTVFNAEGGAIICWFGTTTLVDCVFTGNVAQLGGAIATRGNQAMVDPVNCTFFGNSGGAGGAISLRNCSPYITNCVMWGNSGTQIWEDPDSYAAVNYCCIQGGPTGKLGAGIGNTALDPLFANANGPDNIAGTADDDVRLTAGSPCIDSGSNPVVPAGTVTDLAGNRRFDDDPSVADTGAGTAPLVDMGAYEFALHPLARPDSATTLENVAVTIPVLNNDIPLNGLLLIVAVTDGSKGTVSISGAAVVYTPNLYENGPDSFTYTAGDGLGHNETATVTISITPVNQQPVVTLAASEISLGDDVGAQTITGFATFNPGPPNESSQTNLGYIVQTANPGIFAAAPAISNNGTLTFTPAQPISAASVVTVRARDNGGASNGGADLSDPVTFTITIFHVNHPPVAAGQNLTTHSGVSKAIQLSATDSDGDPLTYSHSEPSHGTLSGAGSALVYHPAAGFAGSASFTFTANDGTDDSNVAVISIEVANTAPVASDRSVSTHWGVPVQITLSATDADSDTLSYTLTQPAHGTLSGAAPQLTYTPAAAFVGSDSFTFTVNDGVVDSNTATVSINVTNSAPVASNLSLSTHSGVPIQFTLPASDADGDALTYSVIAPTHGTLTGSAPQLTYTPAAGYAGADSFTFAVNDGVVSSNTATVSINVTNTAPAAYDLSFSTHAGIAKQVSVSATDADGDTLAYTFTQPAHGTLTGAGPAVEYTPAAGFSGADSFTFTVHDGVIGSNTAMVSITVTNTAPVAYNRSFSTHAGTPHQTTVSATDPDGDELTYAFTQPAHGTLTADGPVVEYTPAAGFAGADSFTFTAHDGVADSNTAVVSITVTNEAPVASNLSVSTHWGVAVQFVLEATDADGDALTYALTQPASGTLDGIAPELTYTPDPAFAGFDSFTFTVNDGVAGSNTAVVLIHIANANPVAFNQTVTTRPEVPVVITLAGTDDDGDPLTYAFTQPLHGTLAGTAPQLTYTPDAGFAGGDSFTFSVNDGVVDSNAALVSIVVANAEPVASDLVVSTHWGVAVQITLAASDADGDAITFTLTQPAHGTLTGTAPEFTYTPAAGFAGADSFTFKVNDGYADSNTATVSIAVTNTAPAAEPQQLTTPAPRAINITLVASDADGDTLSISTTNPAHGTLSGAAPNLTYTPDASFSGDDSFTFTVSDSIATAEALISIIVSATPPLLASGITATPVPARPGDSVQFSCAAADEQLLAWAWTFGDGGTSALENPAHVFTASGAYTVTVIVTDSAGASAARTLTLPVSIPPAARFTTSDVVGFVSYPLVFDATLSTDPENSALIYEWDFGDGSPLGTQQVMAKIYSAVGVYLVRLTVTDAAGASDSTTRQIEVLPASEINRVNGYLRYTVKWTTHKANVDSLTMTATVFAGDEKIQAGTVMSFEIAGNSFSGILDGKLRAKTGPNVAWQVKSGLRNQQAGQVDIVLKVTKATLSPGFMAAGAVPDEDGHNPVHVNIPCILKAGARVFELSIPSEFKFSKNGTIAKGVGETK